MKYFIEMFLRFIMAWGTSPLYLPIMATVYVMTYSTKGNYYLLNQSFIKWVHCASIGVIFPRALK